MTDDALKQNKLEKKNAECLQIEKDLNSCKNHVSYLNSFRNDVQSKFFDLLDQNILLKETLEKVKQEYIILNVDLNQCKSLSSIWDQYDVPTHMFSTKFQKLKLK